VAIYSPNLILSDADREALLLLGQLALTSHAEQSNVAIDEIALSPAEAERLLFLLDQFATSKRFLEGSYFAEGIAKGDGHKNKRLKEIYLSWRKRLGFTRVASTYTWNEFVVRAGFGFGENAWMWPRAGRNAVTQMDLKYFLAMEEKLVDAIGLHPRVRNLIVKFVDARLLHLDALREGQREVRPGSIRRLVQSFVSDLATVPTGREDRPMSRNRVIGLSVILMDTSALFVTRDWTATGVLSTLASVAPDALDYAPPR
jgi:hypothetical protein